jgi:hypothetical protein
MKYSCDHCCQNFKSRQTLYLHRKRKTCLKKKLVYTCQLCNKTFARKFHFDNHSDKCGIFVESEQNVESNTLSNIMGDNKILNNSDTDTNFNTNIDIPEDLLTQITEHNSHNTFSNSKTNTNDISMGEYNSNNSGIYGHGNNVKIENHNNIKIVPLGHENLSDILTAKEQINILNKRCQALEEIIKYVHFNDKYPQFQNMMITDLNRNHAYKYDNDSNGYIMVKKADLISDLIENRVDDIDEFYNNNYSKLSKTSQKVLKDYIETIVNDDEYNEGKYMKDKKKDIELIIYNNQEKVKEKVKEKLLKLKRKPNPMLT